MTADRQGKNGLVIVGMSGGVDSSVAALLLLEQGYDVVGVTLKIWSDWMPGGGNEGECRSRAAVEDARRVAGALGISFHVLDVRKRFSELVIGDFCTEYALGRTPNPCIICNKEIKFAELMRWGPAFGAGFIATGHYARVEYDDSRQRYLLKRGVDKRKDQSYVLYNLDQEQLSQILLPVGALTKDEVRAVAAEHDLLISDKPESQEICFIPDNDYRRFLKEHRPDTQRPGPILSVEGDRMGQHRGIANYTIGQRRGLGIAAREPLYVVDIDPDANAVIVGRDRDTFSRVVIARDCNLISTSGLEESVEVGAKIRYNAPVAAARIQRGDHDGEVVTEFFQAQRAVTPGQAVVWYQGDIVVGGGTIVASGQ